MARATKSKDTSAPTSRKSNGKTTRSRGQKSTDDTMRIDPETRRHMIAEAAYYRAAVRGFAPGFEDADWLAAEQEIDHRNP